MQSNPKAYRRNLLFWLDEFTGPLNVIDRLGIPVWAALFNKRVLTKVYAPQYYRRAECGFSGRDVARHLVRHGVKIYNGIFADEHHQSAHSGMWSTYFVSTKQAPWVAWLLGFDKSAKGPFKVTRIEQLRSAQSTWGEKNAKRQRK